MPQNNPPFRADHVGSLLRPQVLIDTRRQVLARAGLSETEIADLLTAGAARAPHAGAR